MIKLADFIVDFKCIFPGFYERCYGFETPDCASDIVVSCTEEEIMEESIPDKNYSSSYLQYTAMHRKFAEILPLHNAFVFHSAIFDVDDVGVAFAAHSGTGKTTHMLLWQQLLGERMTVVNGDKPIIRFFGDSDLSENSESNHVPKDTKKGIPYAYGTPWNGKEHLGCNMRTHLKHICFIERSQTNFVEVVDKKDVIDYIFNQVYMPKDPLSAVSTISLIDRLLSSCKLWKIHCNTEPEAAKVAYNTIFFKENK